MDTFIYSKRTKLLLIVLQALAAGVLAYCMLNIGFWMEDSYSLKEFSKAYEETDLFFRQVDAILHQKIDGQDNQTLFETGGEFDGEKEIDIQSYGKGPNAVRDLNTTYLLSDLLAFCENGGLDALHKAVSEANKLENRQEAGEQLDKQSGTLETIRPVTGISLSECSRWYSDSAGYVMQMYTRLEEVCQEIYQRYRQYSGAQDESWSGEAPSNLRYCIENSTTQELYTNLEADSYADAAEALAQDTEYTILYEGERSFNIMISNPDNVLNEAAGEWFLEKRFVNTNERVLIAVNLEYPVSDLLGTYADYFSRRESIVWGSVFGVIVSLLVLLTAFALSIASTGWEKGRLAPRLYWMDQIPTELACGLYMVAVVLAMVFLQWKKPDPELLSVRQRVFWSSAAAFSWILMLSACTGFTRRLRSHKLWHNSICRMLLHTWRKVTAARAASVQLLIFYLIFFVLNFALLLFGRVGIFLVFVLDMAVLLYLLRDMAGKQSVWEGIHQISRGDLTYKIDTTTLMGETYEMAKAVNEMGDGLQEAVEAIVKNERLKAELITNVSHDLKTPLTSIVNYVDLLKRENLPGERVQHCIEVLDQKSQRLKQLTEDLVEVSKISSGNVELHMVRIEVRSMLQQAYGEFEERLAERGLYAAWDMPGQPVHIMADGRQFWRILENLLGNCCKYALENSAIAIRLRADSQMAIIELQNTPQEPLHIDAQELMGRFVRGDRSRNTEGSGLGLSIAQSLAELLGGTFQLQLPDGKFAVTMVFPLAKEEPDGNR